jgi:hypothetical protein
MLLSQVRKPIVQVIDAFLRGEKAERGDTEVAAPPQIVRLKQTARAFFPPLTLFPHPEVAQSTPTSYFPIMLSFC